MAFDMNIMFVSGSYLADRRVKEQCSRGDELTVQPINHLR